MCWYLTGCYMNSFLMGNKLCVSNEITHEMRKYSCSHNADMHVSQ